jgi:transcriptional regulator with XRE-family HTH domain
MYGSFIKQARASRGLTQVELAGIVGIEQPNLSAYENDRQMPGADVLNRILVGCGYLLEAAAGGRRITCPVPNAGSSADGHVRSGVQRPAPHDGSASVQRHRDDELSAAKLEQVLALADAIRWSKAPS